MGASSFPGLALPKGITRKTEKGREDRAEAAVVKAVRPQCVERDGYCRIQAIPQEPRLALFGPCDGPSEWSHYNETHRRSKTMGQPPEERHKREHSMMLCHCHSQMYDQNKIRIQELTERGCDGPLRFENPKRGVYEEQE